MFFDSILKSSNQLEFTKYWDFYELVDKIVHSEELAQQLDLADSCYKKHIAIEADSDDRVERVLDRATVNDLKKTLVSCKKDSTSPTSAFKPLQKSAYDHLDQHFFRPNLIPLLDSEKNRRLSLGAECELS